MTDNGNELARVDANAKRELMVAEARMRVGLVSELMNRNLLQEGTHYSRKGLFGGNSKPSLLLPGAEVIANALGVNIGMNCVQHEINNGPFPDGAPATPFIMFSYECVARLQATGVSVTGVGSCNSWEDKYLYRKDWGSKQKVEVGYGIYSAMNTLQKMAKKRAYIDAVKLAASCSDIFTQDLEDLPRETVQQQPQPPQPAVAPPPMRDAPNAPGRPDALKDAYAKAHGKFPGMDWSMFGAQIMQTGDGDEKRLRAFRVLMLMYPDGKQISDVQTQQEVIHHVRSDLNAMKGVDGNATDSDSTGQAWQAASAEVAAIQQQEAGPVAAAAEAGRAGA